MKHLRVFGCAAYPHIPKDEKEAGSKIEAVYFLGLFITTKRLLAVLHQNVKHFL